ncbi:hypothetical protein OIB37_01640 [Streptomyces sp. NBC_00820]|uniref:hypothetical protein n=1 Tax=Streptomyces sp. NBC_00820 TaxID=2975842 RepID=UPI002ED34BC4|nr:hypothetical protein OIB37_01640 [Streptomyces sp. NBC_00820]
MTAARRHHVAGGAAVAAVLVLTVGGCGRQQVPEPTGHITANGVKVTATLLSSADGRRELRTTFSPRQRGFHIYSIDLPAHGVDGLGIPTRLAVRGDLTAAGRPKVNAATRLLRPAGLPTEIPVYPDGPVTFTLPVRQTTSPRHAEVVVSYGACSENRCLMPVIGEVIPLDLN